MRAYARVLIALGAVALSTWGLGWCLPDRARLERVLPPGTDTPAFREALAGGWADLNKRLGPDIILNPESFSYGFKERAEIAPGWTEVPEVLRNSARSYYLRSGHEDEPNLLRAVGRLRPTLEGLNPRIYFYGGGYMYALAAWTAVGAALTPARLVRGVGWYMEDPARMAWLYRLGRAFSALAYLAVAWLLYSTGAKFFSPEAGLSAAALWAASPGFVVQAHYMKPHLMGAFFTLAAYRLAAEALARGPRFGILAGAAAGLAAASVNHLGTAAVFPALAAWMRWRAGSPGRGEAAWLAKAAAACVATFLLCTPYLLTEFATTTAAMRAVGAFAALSARNLFAFAFVGLPAALGGPGALLLAFGLFAAWRGRSDPPRALALAGFSLLYPTVFLNQSATGVDSVRYFGAVTVGVLLAGVAAAELGRPGLAAAGLCVLLAGAKSAVLDYNLALDVPGRSTREAAGDWLEGAAAPGASVGLLRLPQPANAPTFRWDRYRLVFIEPAVFAALGEAEPVPEWLLMTYPSYDDRPLVGAQLSRRYELARAFAPAGPASLRLPDGQSWGNPPIEIYRRKEPSRSPL